MTLTRRHRNERIAAAVFVFVALIAVAAFILWNRAEEEALRQDLRYIPKRETITPEILLLRDYVRIDTSTAQGAATGAHWIAGLLRTQGVQAEIIESTPGRLNVYARIKGKQNGGGLLLLNHIDVVPARAEQWAHPPFAAETHINQLWGRGALDMKAIALCQILAIADLQRSGRQPEHDIAFLATAEEEQGSEHGLKWLLTHRPDLFEGIAHAITEGGITEVITERMVYFGIETGSKQKVELVLSAPRQETLLEARTALEPYMTSREQLRVIPEVRQFFRDVAPARSGMKRFLTDIDATIARGEAWALPLAYRDLMQNTMQVNAPAAETETKWVMFTLMVNLPDEDPDARIRWLRDFVERRGITVDVWKKEGPVRSSSTDTPLFGILANEAKKLYRVHAGSEILYSSTSDCRFLRARGVNCYGVSPYRADIAQALTIHRPNERIRLDWFMDGVEYMRRAVRTYARQP